MPVFADKVITGYLLVFDAEIAVRIKLGGETFVVPSQLLTGLHDFPNTFGGVEVREETGALNDTLRVGESDVVTAEIEAFTSGAPL